MSTSDIVPAAPRPTTITQSTAVEQARAVAEVQAAVTVAQAVPRDMVRVLAEMRQACSRKGLAERAFYSVPNRGSGPSVHLARELARVWGNFDYGVKELRRDDESHESEIEAYAWDQQTNTRNRRLIIVPHARMKTDRATKVKSRETLVDLGDIYGNNQSQGARVMRECIFATLPRDFVDEAVDLCRATLEKGDGKPLEARIDDVVKAFAGLGVKVAAMEARLGKRRGQWDAGDLAALTVVGRSIRNGETTTGDEFPDPVTADEITAGAKPAEQPRQQSTPATPVEQPPAGFDDAAWLGGEQQPTGKATRR